MPSPIFNNMAKSLSSFYRDETGQPSLKNRECMIEWAKRAGKLVFQEAEELHEENIVTFCNLALFWHSQGSWRISHLHKGMRDHFQSSPPRDDYRVLLVSNSPANASQLLYITGLGSTLESRVDSSLDAEIRRRRFWACYLLHCYSSERLSLFQPVDDAQSLPLPWPEPDYDSGLSRPPCPSLTSDGDAGGFLAN